ncbi:MAG: hypothetical protein ACRENS_12795, partial [Candidatus Eiseniibacteriota bacterium]
AYRKALELAPGRSFAPMQLAFVLMEQGHAEAALAEIAREPAEMERLFARALICRAAGREAESMAALAQLIEQYSSSMAFQIAEVFAVLGEIDRAFEWLERAYTQRDSGLTESKASSRLRSLHTDPRWAAFMVRMGLSN